MIQVLGVAAVAAVAAGIVYAGSKLVEKGRDSEAFGLFTFGAIAVPAALCLVLDPDGTVEIDIDVDDLLR